MVENTERSDFMKMVDDVRLAEQEADEVLNAAKIKADKTLRQAKEDVQKQNAETNEKIVQMKNSMLESGAKDIEKDVKKILDKALTDAEKVRKVKLDKKGTDTLIKLFLSTQE
jgi:vacuolar-type H+-ATPase subunit H